MARTWIEGHPRRVAPSLWRATGGILDALVTDQRGRLRVDGDGSGGVRCDVGAYEFAAITTDLTFADGF